MNTRIRLHCFEETSFPVPCQGEPAGIACQRLESARSVIGMEGFPPVEVCATQNKVLVVDDDAGVRELLKKLLQTAGYDVVLAENGLEALEQFDAQALDMILLDLGLPDGSGWDIFEQIKSEDPTMPMVILTGRSNQLQMAATAGVRALMEKPVDPLELSQTIKAVIVEPRNVRLRHVSGEAQHVRYHPSRHQNPLRPADVGNAPALGRWPPIGSAG